MMLALILAGDFGWNAGMVYGWPSMFLGYVLATILFWMLGLSVAEMSCSLPFSGGAATFAQAAFGQEVSAFLALSFTFAYCAGTAWAIESLASYAVVLFNFPADANNMQPLLWLALAEIFVLTNIRTRHFFKIAIAIAAFCCTAIAVYVVCSLAHLPTFQGALYQPDLPVTFLSVMQAWPWAMGFYWGLEAIPLTAEECHDITTTAPRAVKITLTVLTVFAGIALCLAVGMMPDLDTLLNSNQPMLDSFFWQLGVAPASALATADVIMPVMLRDGSFTFILVQFRNYQDPDNTTHRTAGQDCTPQSCFLDDSPPDYPYLVLHMQLGGEPQIIGLHNAKQVKGKADVEPEGKRTRRHQAVIGVFGVDAQTTYPCLATDSSEETQKNVDQLRSLLGTVVNMLELNLDAAEKKKDETGIDWQLTVTHNMWPLSYPKPTKEPASASGKRKADDVGETSDDCKTDDDDCEMEDDGCELDDD
ncbi:hypothetical protein RI367_002408 [Sorochytrium milnesiophthora]